MEGAEQNESGGLNSSQTSNNELNTSTLSKQGSNAKKKTASINIKDNNSINRKSSNTKLALVRKNTKRHDSKRSSKKKLSRKKTIKSHRDSNKLPDNIYVFRPPIIWNYPYHRLFKLKHQNEGENVITEIRNVDPTLCYKDNRVQKFMELFTEIFNNMKTYWRTEKPNTWDYFFNKVLKALGISYVSYKMLREEEEEQKKKQEEEEKKRKEEEENESKQKEMIEFLEKHTHETYIEKKMEEDFKKEQEEKEAKEKEKGKGKKDAKKKK